MAKIREDLIGAVHVSGHVLYAGDAVPSGVKVGSYLTAGEKVGTVDINVVPSEDEPAAEKPKPKRGRSRKKPSEDDDDANVG